MVNNKNYNQRVKRQNRTENEPALTIYPLDKLDFLNKPKIELKSKIVAKNTKNTANTVINSDLNNKNHKSSNQNEPKKKEDKIPRNAPQVRDTTNEKPKPECVTISNVEVEKVFG